MYIIKLALRNIMRNKRRSLLAVLSVLLALFLMVFMEGLLNGMLGSITLNATKSDTGHIMIVTKEYRDRQRFLPVDANIADPQAIIRTLEADPRIGPRIDRTAMRIRFGTLLEYEGRNKTALGIGGDLEGEKRLLMLDRSIVDGRYAAGAREAVIGEGLAEDLGVKVGSVLKVQARTAEGSTNMRKFTVVGIFRTGLDTLDSSVFLVSLDDARALIRSGSGVQQILVMLKDYRQAGQTAGMIAAALGDPSLAVVPWLESSDIFGFLSVAAAMFNAIYLFIAFLGTIIIVNIMMMVVLERRREIGIMKAMGVSRGEILRIFTAEGLVLGIIGSIAGILFGLALTAVMSKTGLNLGDSIKGMNIPLSNVVYPVLTAAGVLKVFAVGVLASGIISLLPARRAARMDAVAAMKSTL
jgi:putative ABC transport system permease protein